MCLLSPAPFPEFLNIIDVDKDSRLALNCLARGHLIKHHTEKVAQHQRCLVEGHLFLRLVGLNCQQWPLQHWVWAVSAAQRHHPAALSVGSVSCTAASHCRSGCGQCRLHSGITLQVWVWAVSAAQRHHPAALGVGSVGCTAASHCSSGCGQCQLHSGITLQLWVWAVSAAQSHHTAALGVGSVGCTAASLCSSGCGPVSYTHLTLPTRSTV